MPSRPKCHTCQVGFEDWPSLFDHRRIIDGDQAYQCPLCLYVNSSRRYILERHVPDRHPNVHVEMEALIILGGRPQQRPSQERPPRNRQRQPPAPHTETRPSASSSPTSTTSTPELGSPPQISLEPPPSSQAASQTDPERPHHLRMEPSEWQPVTAILMVRTVTKITNFPDGCTETHSTREFLLPETSLPSTGAHGHVATNLATLTPTPSSPSHATSDSSPVTQVKKRACVISPASCPEDERKTSSSSSYSLSASSSSSSSSSPGCSGCVTPRILMTKPPHASGWETDEEDF